MSKVYKAWLKLNQRRCNRGRSKASEFSTGIRKGDCRFVVKMCSVPDRINFAIVVLRLRKFKCSSPFRYFSTAVEQSNFFL